jgi:hypothetical protein
MTMPPSRRCGLNLAAVAVALQFLGGFLPSRVVCCRPDRPPQVEFFSGACSCHQRDAHAADDQERQGAPRLTGWCVDLHLGFHAAPVDSRDGSRLPGPSRQDPPAARGGLPQRDGHFLDPGFAGCGPPANGAPPPAVLPADFCRRC